MVLGASQTVGSQTVGSQIDDDLAYLTAEWESVAETVAEWTEWTERERLDFVLEWPLREDRLGRLRRWHAEGRFSDQQRRRYDDLLGTIRRHRTALDRLLAD